MIDDDGPPYRCEYCGATESQKGRPFMTPQQLGGHVRACRKNPDSYLYEGPADDRDDAPPPGGETPSRSPSSPSQGEAPPGGFYPLIEELERAEVGNQDTRLLSVGDDGEGLEGPSPEPPEDGQAQTQLMDLTWVWSGIGDFLDQTLFKDAPMKCNITPEKAKVMEQSVQAMGLTVTENPNPIELPYYVPAVATGFGYYGLPFVAWLAAKYGPKETIFGGGEEDGSDNG